MRHKVFGILALLICSFLFAVPASAFNLPACSPSPPFPGETNEFVLIGQDNIIFEPQSPNSGRVINGNVLVTNPNPSNVGSNTGTGFVKVGANTEINGSVIAHTILLPDGGATIAHCIANVIVANTPAAKASCGTGYPVVGTPFTDYATAHPGCVGSLTALDICGDTPEVNACVIGKPKLTVGIVFPTPAQAGLVDALGRLKPDCYGVLVLEAGAVLNLAPGVFTFASVEMRAGSKLIGAPSTVNVNGTFHTNAGVLIQDLDLNIAFNTSAEVAKIFNNSKLDNVDINAPLGKCHLHTGTALVNCSEACCKVLDVQPITAVCVPDINEVCVCPAGFRFELPPLVAVFDQSPVDNRARNCVQCQAGDGPPCP